MHDPKSEVHVLDGYADYYDQFLNMFSQILVYVDRQHWSSESRKASHWAHQKECLASLLSNFLSEAKV